MVLAALPRAVPYWLATLVAMALLPSLLELFFQRGPGARQSRAGAANTPLQLPDSLRFINVLRRFEVELESGVVTTATRVDTTSDGSGGSDVYSEGVVWVRDLSERETAWRVITRILIAGEQLRFDTRQGQVVSRRGLRSRGDGSEFVLAYNHATRQIVPLDGLDDAFEIRTSRLPWLATTALGAAGFVVGIGAIARQLGPAIQGGVDWFGGWLFGAVVSAIVRGSSWVGPHGFSSGEGSSGSPVATRSRWSGFLWRVPRSWCNGSAHRSD